ncbi:nuclear transport factor 2 family protein [Flavisphingomonas formosensis]|uniref:nuclear transport factor 2 family protein n=1 Tax=Flavisphingomonas formosensis TaxID=861534 RepID=UPI0012F856B9|nr:nuclear transport factor 2 family protein [Sphingomonas formosensis]
MAGGANHPSPEAVILGYFEDISAKRFAAARARIADDATWWVVGEGRWPLGGTYSNRELGKLFGIVDERFPEGLQITVQRTTSEGDRVVVEAESHGIRRDGRSYNNNYVFIFIVRDGLIRHRREYCDMFHADDLLCGSIGDGSGATASDSKAGTQGYA